MAGWTMEQLENGLRSVIVDLGDELSLSERQEVVEFVDVGEYGVALETLCSLLVEEEKTITSAVHQDILGLATAMGLEVSAAVKGLGRQVVGD